MGHGRAKSLACIIVSALRSILVNLRPRKTSSRLKQQVQKRFQSLGHSETLPTATAKGDRDELAAVSKAVPSNRNTTPGEHHNNREDVISKPQSSNDEDDNRPGWEKVAYSTYKAEKWKEAHPHARHRTTSADQVDASKGILKEHRIENKEWEKEKENDRDTARVVLSDRPRKGILKCV